MPLKPGDALHAQYQILGLLGRGGFGYVYRARGTLLDRDVAIKELIPALVDDPSWVKRFPVEARATLELHHPHVVATHTLFAESGNHYLVMVHMPGGPSKSGKVTELWPSGKLPEWVTDLLDDQVQCDQAGEYSPIGDSGRLTQQRVGSWGRDLAPGPGAAGGRLYRILGRWGPP